MPQRVKNSIRFKSQIGFKLWKTKKKMWILIDLGKQLEGFTGFGLCPLSGILKNSGEHNSSEIESLSVLTLHRKTSSPLCLSEN
jgi:hypothetical protein